MLLVYIRVIFFLTVFLIKFSYHFEPSIFLLIVTTREAKTGTKNYLKSYLFKNFKIRRKLHGSSQTASTHLAEFDRPKKTLLHRL